MHNAPPVLSCQSIYTLTRKYFYMIWIGLKTNSTYILPSVFYFSEIFQEKIIECGSRVKVWLIQLPNFKGNYDLQKNFKMSER